MRDESEDFDQSRLRMVKQQLAGRGISDKRVLDVMEEVPRHLFVPADMTGSAYRDGPLPIGQGQTISQPYIVAFMTQMLLLTPESRVLEIGTGSGYQTAILSRLAAEVYTVERIQALAQRAKALLDRLGYNNVQYRVGDGSLGWPEAAPFDAIILTAAAPHVPLPLLDQLADNGNLVAPVGPTGYQTLIRLHKEGDETTREVLTSVAFVPLFGKHGWGERGPET